MGDSQRRPEEAVGDGWVLLLGDAMEDVYLEGYAKDISAEAPIVRTMVHTTKVYPGGAANVGKLLQESGVHPLPVFGEGLPKKCRVLADGHQVARFDLEDSCRPLTLPPNMDLEGCRAVVVSDYCKGSIDNNILVWLYNLPPSIKLLIDTKRSPYDYPFRAMFFPNDKEYVENNYEDFRTVRKVGPQGLWYNGLNYHWPALEVISVVGAGDVVLAGFVYAMLGGQDYPHCADFASFAGTRKVECPRTEAPPLKEMFEQWQTIMNERE